MKLNAISPDGLRTGDFQCGPRGSLNDAMLSLVIEHFEGAMTDAREEQRKHGDEDILEEYGFELSPDLLTKPMLDKLVAVFVNAGWEFSEVIEHTLVIARKPIHRSGAVTMKKAPDSRLMVRGLPLGKAFADATPNP